MAKPYYADELVSIYHGDSLDVVPRLEEPFAAVVTDPPYGLGFMGRDWDKALPDPAIWQALLEASLPGAHMVACGAPRLYHRLAVSVEDTGWEIRDCLSWLYGSGFPKSLDVSKAIDKAAGAERETVRTERRYNEPSGLVSAGRDRKLIERRITAPATDEAKRWQGWGTALKPAWEPILLARRPLDGTVARNVLAHGTGGINVDGCRVGASKRAPYAQGRGWEPKPQSPGTSYSWQRTTTDTDGNDPNVGRWPANLVLDEEAAEALDAQTGTLVSGSRASGRYGLMGYMGAGVAEMPGVVGDRGGASRFFYVAKASRAERERGLEGLAVEHVDPSRADGSAGRKSPRAGAGRGSRRANTHPTVKPVALMRWLLRLVTPPGGLVVDPFAGSGTTGVAAKTEGVRCVLIERNEKYAEIAAKRVEATTRDAQASLGI